MKEQMDSQKESHLLEVYPKRDITLVKGEGALIYDSNGKEYIDCAANVGVNNIGYGVEEVADALKKQYMALPNCYGIFDNPVREQLAEKLIKITPKNLTKVFLCNSGSEAIEAAIKFARGTTKKSEIIAFMRGFHGKTLGALSATWGKEYQEPFKPLLPNVKHIPFNNMDKINNIINADTAAIIIELVQAEGGIRVADKEFVLHLRKLCDEKDILLIIDEVQTGFGRCGTMFACEQFVQPDILCLAKSIAGGVPMGAVICSNKINIPLKSHTSTFGGNPLACAASLAAINYMEKNNLVEQSSELGEYFLHKLKLIESDKIEDIRSLGLMIGIEFKDRAGDYVKKLQENGVIALLAGKRVLRLLPPLVINKDQIDIVIDKLKSALVS